MILNWVERLVVNNPMRVLIQNQIVEWMKNAGKLAAGPVILEVGCGRGAGARMINKRFKPGALHIMDLDLKMLNLAKRNLRHAGATNVSLCLGDLESLPYQANRFDAVFGFGVLHHLINWRGALLDISRVLKPGGVYFLEEFYPPSYMNYVTKRLLSHPEHDRFYSADLREELERARLPLREFREIENFGIIGTCVKC